MYYDAEITSCFYYTFLFTLQRTRNPLFSLLTALFSSFSRTFVLFAVTFLRKPSSQEFYRLLLLRAKLQGNPGKYFLKKIQNIIKS